MLDLILVLVAVWAFWPRAAVQYQHTSNPLTDGQPIGEITPRDIHH